MHSESIILVVEDDDPTRQLVAEILSGHGYSVSEAANGREALAYLNGGLRPEVIVLDLVMPVMNGWQFLKECAGHPQYSMIPVVVLSGVTFEHRQHPDLPTPRYVAKPFTDDGLLAAVEAACVD